MTCTLVACALVAHVLSLALAWWPGRTHPEQSNKEQKP